MKAPSLKTLRGEPELRIKNCERIIGYIFRNQKYIKEALTPIGSNNNQRLALLGDRILDSQLAARWYDDKQRLAPSQWQLIRNHLVSNRNLAEICVRLRIQNCTLTRCGGGRNMATTMEAIIAAVWLDSKRDFGAVHAVMERLSLTNNALIRSPKTAFTTKQPPCELHEVHSSRSLPGRFFVGHHLGLLQLLFRHSQSFIVQHRAGQHDTLSRHETSREAATERHDIGMWSRLRHILSAPQVMPETAQKRTAARVTRKYKNSGQEPNASDTANPPKRQAPAQVLATGEQKIAEHDDSALNIAPPVQQLTTLGDHDSTVDDRHDDPTGWHSKDTEYKRVGVYIWSVSRDWERNLPDRNKIIDRLRAHREVLLKLPGKSLKKMPEGFSTDGVYLMTHSADEYFDRLLALQALDLTRRYRTIERKKGRRRNRSKPLKPEEKRSMRLLERQLAKLWNARLELWLPEDARKDRTPSSLPNPAQLSVSSSETTGAGLPAPVVVDSTRVTTTETCDNRSPHRPGSVLWTTHIAQHNSVDWKQYLSKPTSENQQRT